MVIRDILALAHAGYSAEQIEAMSTENTSTSAPQPTQTQSEPKTFTFTEAQLAEMLGGNSDQEKPIAEKEPATESKTTTMSDAQFTQLMQNLRAKGATIDVPPARTESVDNVLANRLSVLMTGKASE